MSSIRGNRSRLDSPLTWDSLPEELVRATVRERESEGQ